MPCYNYAKFVQKAIKSVIKQTLEDWEFIIINDGSTDNTLEIISKYKDHQKIRIIDQKNKGLNVTNNIALRLSNGNYIMRLDADDYLDENALLVMSSILDTKPTIGLVYPDYYHIDVYDNIIEMVRRENVNDEFQILDIPAHGACTMFRKNVLLQMGGYIEEFSVQDGYEIWLRFIRNYSPYHVNVPLFYTGNTQQV
jgi:glycosyltransferase involved in cell wall biosynthesis